MTELSGIELRKAVATALGWTVSEDRGDGEMYRLDLADGLRPAVPLVPHFDSSLDACFAPGGPVERLRADHGLDLGMTEADTWLAVFYPMSGDEGGGSAESSNPAEAVCRAFLAAVS